MSRSHRCVDAKQAAGKIRAYILGTNRLLREALAHRLRIRGRIEVLGADEAAHANLQALATLRPDVLLINGGSPKFDWAGFIPRARRVAPESRVILFSMEDDTETFFRSIRAGVTGYVLDEASASDLVKAVCRAANGEAVCPPRLCGALFKYVHAQVWMPNTALLGRHGLTRREQQLIPLIS
jgi:DNA-binding NarL/FixJ family response regulator